MPILSLITIDQLGDREDRPNNVLEYNVFWIGALARLDAQRRVRQTTNDEVVPDDGSRIVPAPGSHIHQVDTTKLSVLGDGASAYHVAQTAECIYSQS